MKYYIIAGEASGDLHGSNLIRHLKLNDSEADVRCWGGELMQQQGAKLVKHYRDTAFMGFVEVIKNLGIIRKLFKFCHQDILDFQPDIIILIDYPGFNLRIAKWAFEHDVKVFYYISPQLWAWHSSRVKQVKKYVSKMFVILPFEKDFYQKYQYEVDYVGHPLLDITTNYKTNTNFLSQNGLNEKPIIALLPGSRKQEIYSMLPIMLEMIDQFKDYQFVVAGAPSQSAEFYQEIIKDKPVKIVFGKTYDLLDKSYAALVTSGTATLETALFKVPQVVCYKANALSYQIAKRLVSIKYISLVNLIADKLIVKELIQNELNTQNLSYELAQILDKTKRVNILSNYDQLIALLGNRGASEKTARLMINYLQGEDNELFI
ncbi:MAG: lipid-A-disaccharide synthase [Saprospiraceae bacterium]|nr:lipid-A-disaccharide synthase [Saprospiraceae bacterium]